MKDFSAAAASVGASLCSGVSEKAAGGGAAFSAQAAKSAKARSSCRSCRKVLIANPEKMRKTAGKSRSEPEADRLLFYAFRLYVVLYICPDKKGASFVQDLPWVGKIKPGECVLLCARLYPYYTTDCSGKSTVRKPFPALFLQDVRRAEKAEKSEDELRGN